MPEIRTKVIRSETLNPWMNLACEDMLFSRIKNNEAVLFLWRNTETVVIGRYQNPWVECRLGQMKSDGVGLARRLSGGGAVYHDPGNLNFTFISASGNNDKVRNFEIVLKALDNLGIPAELNSRNDIIIEGKKVSGSAFKLTRQRSYHHGTLLVSSDLNRLQTYLRPHSAEIESKGIRSVRSEVTNISDYLPSLNTEGLEEALIDSFFAEAGRGSPDRFSPEEIKEDEDFSERYERIRSREWVYGKSPDFTHRISGNFDWGAVQVQLDIANAEISAAVVAIETETELMGGEIPGILKKELNGRPYFRQNIPEACSRDVYMTVGQKKIISDVLKLIASKIPEA